MDRFLKEKDDAAPRSLSMTFSSNKSKQMFLIITK